MSSPNASSEKPPPKCWSSQSPQGPLAGASAAGAPGTIVPANSSPSGVLRLESARTFGTESRPLFTSFRANACRRASDSTASRNVREMLLLGVMKSVDRVELRMFSSAAATRSESYVSSSDSGACPRSTISSFQTRLSASCMPLFAPRAPKGLTRCAASPANSTRPWRNFCMRRHWNV